MATTPKIRRSYKGAPIAAALDTSGVSSATQTSVSLSSSPTSWPTGKFFVVVAPGTAQEEKMCVTLSGSVLTVCDPFVSSTAASANGRGVDNTTARTAIAGGSTVYPVATAIDFDEANALTSTYANAGGIVYLGDPSFTQLAIGTAGQALKVNSGATAPEWGALPAAGLATDSVETAKIKNAAVTAEKLATDAVEEAKIKDGAVTSAKIADGTIVNADINASAAIVDTKLATISTANKVSVTALDIDGATDIGGDLADADLVIVDDGAGGTNRKSALSRFATYLFGKVSGDITTTSSGVASIGTGKVTSTHILDGTIVNADINASAAIALTKLAETAWSTWTLTTSGMNVKSYVARYQQIGKTVNFYIGIVLNTGGVTSTTHSVTLPVTAKTQANLTGLRVVIYDYTASNYLASTVALTTSTVAIETFSVGPELSRIQTSGSNPFAMGADDQIIIHGTYEAA